MPVSIERAPRPDSDRLALSVRTPDGVVHRWGDDERSSERIPGGLTLSSSVPGGDADLGCELLRDMTRRRGDDLTNFNEVRAYGPGNETVWRGSLARTPSSASSVSPAAVGDAARLREDPSLRMLCVDRRLDRWAPMPNGRLISLGTNWWTHNTNVSIEGASGDLDAGVTFDSNRIASNAGFPFHLGEAFYDSLGVPIGAIYYDFGDTVGIWAPDANWDHTVHLMSAYGTSYADVVIGTDHNGSAAVAQLVTSTNPAVRFAMLQQVYKGTFTGDGAWRSRFKNLAVYGQDVARVANPAGGPPGVQAQAVLRAILDKAKVGISYDADSIAFDAFVLPQLAWLESVTPEQAILDTNRFYRNLWAVYDRKLYWRAPESFGRLWRVRRSEGAQIQSAGPDAESDYNGVVVSYDDPVTASRQVVGPPETGLRGPLALSTANLRDTDPATPLNRWGRRRFASLSASSTSEAGGIRLGELFMAGMRARRISGSIEISAGQAISAAGARVPAWAPKAGDRILVEDDPAGEERLIIEASYSHDSRSSTLTLDAPPNAMESLLERLQVVLEGVVD